MEDEVTFESHQEGEPCEEVMTRGNERIQKGSACGGLSATGKDAGNRSSESFLCSWRTSIITPKEGGR